MWRRRTSCSSTRRSRAGNQLGVHVRFTGRTASGDPHPWYEVVGVVDDLAMQVHEGENADFIFRPASPAELPSFAVGIHVRSGAAEFARRLPALAAQVAPNLLLYDVLPLDEVIRRRTLPDVQAAMTVVAIALLFLALSAGLYSLMSVAVTRRTREIGIRVAIGASPRAVLTTLFGRAAVQVGSGILLGTCSCPRS